MGEPNSGTVIRKRHLPARLSGLWEASGEATSQRGKLVDNCGSRFKSECWDVQKRIFMRCLVMSLAIVNLPLTLPELLERDPEKPLARFRQSDIEFPPEMDFR